MDLTATIAGVTLKNPVTVSSGIVTRSVHGMKRCIEAGAGAIATKSISFVPSSWSLPRPSCFMLDKYGDPGSSYNIELGFPTPEQGAAMIEEVKPLAKAEGAVIIGNIGLTGDTKYFTKEEILARTLDLARELVAAGAGMIEIARLCGIIVAKELGGDFTKLKDYEFVESLVRYLKAELSVPLILRVSYPDVLENVAGFDAAGVDAYSFASGIFATVIDIETGRPVVPFSRPYHGRGCRTIQNHQVATLAKKTQTPLIPSGGITTSRDIIESLIAGATNCQIHTSVMRYGTSVIAEMIEGLKSFMARKGYQSINDIIRLAVPHIDNIEEYAQFVSERQVPKEAMTMKINKQICVGCGECADACPYGAMSMSAGYPKWRYEACEFCGICSSICPVDAITIRPRG